MHEWEAAFGCQRLDDAHQKIRADAAAYVPSRRVVETGAILLFSMNVYECTLRIDSPK